MQHKFIDVHTHNEHTDDADALSIINRMDNFESINSDTYYTFGLHPCYLNEWETQFVKLKEVATAANVLGIGECGLDRLSVYPMDVQMEVFQQQIALAKQVRKPLIIHCVRAYDEVMKRLSDNNVSVPVIFHGYNKKEAIAGRLLHNRYYLSFGTALLATGSPSISVFRNIPDELFLLETDDGAHNIKNIYKAAAEIRNTTIEAIILQVQKNFKTVFNHDD